ncbi:MAG: hypothetical protein ACMVO5_02920 [Polymorphobacter sp.]|uniref:hypothetical protein n=1 Tax=Polymorphobacter sp. TaxID=1909290 RepID=UPI003A8BA104
MSDESSFTPPPRWPLWLAGAATLLWLLSAVAAAVPLLPGLALPEGFAAIASAAAALLGLAAPLALIWFIALRLQDGSRARAERAALMAEQTRITETRLTQSADAIGQLEYRLSELTGQLTAMAKPVERQHMALAATITGLQTATNGLKEAVETAEAATSRLGSETPVATERAEALSALLENTRAALTAQLTEAEALLVRLGEHLAAARTEANATATDAEARIAAITAATTAASEALQTPLGALADGVDAALGQTNAAVETARAALDAQTSAVNDALAAALATTEQSLEARADAMSARIDEALARASSAVDSTRDTVQAQTNALLASVDQARTSIEHIGGEAASAIAARLAALTGGLTGLGNILDDQAGRADSLMSRLQDAIARFDAALAASAEQGEATLASVDTRVTQLRSGLDALAEPVNGADAGLGALVGHMTTLDAAAAAFFSQLAEAVPDAVPGLDDLSARLARLHDETNALAGPIEAGADTLASAQSRLEAAGQALDDATEALQSRLASAETMLASLTASTENEALAATTSLLESFSRIKEIAAQSAGTMRETLSGVVAEAEAALDSAATAKAEAAFGAPVRTALAALEGQQKAAAAAAQAAAERVTARLMALTQTVASVETHFDKRQTEVEIRERSSLTRRATELLANLKDQAIDLTRLLALNIEDQAYEEWLAGDRSRFLRGLALALDGDVGRAITRHMAHDAAFRVDASRFTQDFEALIAHVSADRQGRALAATLLASDPGKLYLALTQANDD